MKHIRPKSGLILFLLIFLFAFCKHEKKNKFQPGLPNSENFNKEYKSDSCLFSISIKGDSILIADNDTSCFIKDFNYIDSFVCTGLKSGRIDPEKDYPIILYIDSMTPYPVVDRLIEELLLIDFNGFYFKTNNKGFKLGFPERDYELEEELIRLYGQKFERRRSIINKCYEEKKSNMNVKVEAPPPPPPPPPPPIMDLVYINTDGFYNNDDNFNYCIVGIKENIFQINNKPKSREEFIKVIAKKKAVFVSMNFENDYKDFIKVIDVINSVINVKQNYYSLIIYKKNFADLIKEQQNEIVCKHRIHFMILSFALRNYIESQKDEPQLVKFAAPIVIKKNKY